MLLTPLTSSHHLVLMHNLSDMAELVGNSALGWPSRPHSSRAALAPCMGPMPMLAMRFQGPEEYKNSRAEG